MRNAYPVEMRVSREHLQWRFRRFMDGAELNANSSHEVMDFYFTFALLFMDAEERVRGKCEELYIPVIYRDD